MLFGDLLELSAADAAGLIHEIGFGRAGDTEIDAARPERSAPTRPEGSPSCEEVRRGDRVVLPGDTVDRNAAVLERAPSQRMLDFAGDAPGGEDVRRGRPGREVGRGEALLVPAIGGRSTAETADRSARKELARIARAPAREIDEEHDNDDEGKSEIQELFHGLPARSYVGLPVVHGQRVAGPRPSGRPE